MSRPLWIAFAGVVLLGAGALAAVLVFTDPDRASPSAAAHLAQPQAASRPMPAAAPGDAAPAVARPSLPVPALPPGAVVVPPSPQAVQPGEPPPGAVTFESPEERADTLTEMQQQRMKSGMDALNERAARRAAQARPVGSRSPAR